MLSRFITAISLESGGEGSVATSAACAGVPVKRVGPSIAMPRSASAVRNAPAVNAAGSSATIRYRRVPAFAPIVPRTSTTPSERVRATIRASRPATVRTDAVSGRSVDGSSQTDAAPPRPGATATQMRFSFNDSAETRAA